MKTKTIILSLFIVLLQLNVSAQKYYTKSKKAIKYFEKALSAYELRYNEEATLNVKKALKKDANFIEAYLLLAEIYKNTKNYNGITASYKKIIQIDKTYEPSVYYFLGSVQLSNGVYDSAYNNFTDYKKYEKHYQRRKEKTDKKIQQSKFGANAVKNANNIEFIKLPSEINTKYNEYWPTLTIDEKTLYFTRLIPNTGNIIMEKFQEDFFVSEKKDKEWQKAKNLGPPLNTFDNEGAMSISADGRMMVFSLRNRQRSYGGFDIYYSKKINHSWTQAKNIGKPINSAKWEAQPSLSADGRTIYFVSNRDGGKGGKDIWCSKLNENGKWLPPVNLGDSINTPGNEQSPFIHPDNQTLFFSSDHWLGMGGDDLFFTKKKDDNSWTTPKNLGYPINTHKNEIGLIVNAKGELAYFASDRSTNTGTDIYQFNLPTAIKPNPTNYVQGKVYHAENKNPLKASFELIDLKENKTIVQSYSDNLSGTFLLPLPINKSYALNVQKDGYLFFSLNFDITKIHDLSKPFMLDVPLQPIKTGNIIVLENVFFEHDSYKLKSESYIELNKLIEVLTQNPTIKIEIGGHTDSNGSDKYNETLSHNRSQTVYNYLIEKGINANRLTYRGYGEKMPRASNETPKGRALNRRTEVKIL